MKVRAGIIGPKDSVELICEAAAELTEKLIVMPFIYQNEHEAPDIIKQNSQLVDLWVFSGIAPVLHTGKNETGHQFFFLSIDGTSLKKTMLEISYNHRLRLERISYDLIAKKDLHEAYGELGLATDHLYVYEVSEESKAAGDIVSFHEKLYTQRKVDVCVSGIRSVYEELCKKGIPAFRIKPSRQKIRETLKNAYQEYQTQHFKQSQIAVMQINLEQLEKKADHHSISYDVHRLQLKLKTEVLSFSERISGSYISSGAGSFIIFSTRGGVQTIGQLGKPLIDQIALLTELNVNIGIGYGETVLSAEEKANLALHYAQNYGGSCIFLVDDRGTVKGPLKEEQSISFSFRTENKETIEKLKRCGVAVTSYNKILSVQKRMGNHTISAFQIAEWLNMTQRNARRILNSLVQEGLAEIVGEEAPTSKGRPRKIYRIGSKIISPS